MVEIAPDKPGRITVRGLGVRRGETQALRGVDLDIVPGAMTALVGRNGCGKSTLLKTIARILRPETGEIEVDGTTLARLSPRAAAQRMALLPQSPILPEGMRVRDLVAQGRHPHRGLVRHWSPEDDAAIDAAMAATDTVQFADRRLEALSGGQRQRCWIAMTLAQDTPILLLDEPTTYLDLSVQLEIMGLLARLARKGRTILVVLHELNLAAAFADRIVMMRDGQIDAEGPPSEVLTAPLLQRVFGLDARIIADPDTGRPVCLPRTAA
ncbi:iron complex transport system ATP-binding protein [Roseivivax halotolerans]|uniref:Iron complex transport system ATP-binding protein n=1 Tax=Roseivivax halotolerans TaxID=93684 RepID=A0A1I5Z7Y6_9RHOB|nr:ABC transporter ATP-binding protein [Roseivivax halotolerans]SFQ52580.1 iron complex transport system ATP-binding protein [Roseivivax halotolerans]